MKLSPWYFFSAVSGAAAVLLSGCGSPKTGNSSASPGGATLLNVSYDPTRELYQDYNAAFAKYWQGKTGQTITLQQSHGGSGKQARAVKDGLAADVVTLGIATDIDALAQAGLVSKDWQSRFPNHSAPYTSTIVFLVRHGNPKGIKDWPDLVKPGVSVITPNPKSSSGGRWNYLAAWGYAAKQPGGGPDTARAFVSALYKNVPILDSGARGATVTFARHNVGDVLLTWENEAHQTISRNADAGKFDIVTPPASILAEPPVAVVDKNADAHKTRKAATAYLAYLYSPEGQTIAAKRFYRPRDPKVAAQSAAQFPPLTLFTAESVFGSLPNAQKTHFADGGIFDQIYAKH